uniref:BACON domain-containing protein n=1 Tax=Acetithermum autotrophicum TaxID=1446466 RepID=H5SRM9_ACEAU|nr:hypothetical protein HGMM_OP2C294 [Candidatus Acetothermum autotrophicum]
MSFRIINGLLVSLSLMLGLAAHSLDTAPEITFVDFPKQIQADDNPVSGFIFFKDPDADVVRAEFLVVQATDFQPFSLDLKVKGVKEGIIEFQIATRTPQQVVLRAVLIDAAGNRSAPWEFSFEAVRPGQPPPPSQNPVLQVMPTTLSFIGEARRNPPSQTLQITNTGTGTLIWSASTDQFWISLNPSSGTAPSTITVSVNATLLTAGSYQGRITITALGAQSSPTTVFVTLTLIEGSTQSPILYVSPSFLSFQGEEGGRGPAPQTITITNIGSGTMSWTVAADSFWLRLDTDRGSLMPGWSAEVRVSVSLEGLTAGSYTGRVTVTAPGAYGSPAIITVILILNARPVAPPDNLRIFVSTNTKRICSSSVSHELTVNWRVTGGRPPVSVTMEVIDPNGIAQRFTDLPMDGERRFSFNFPRGGSVQINMMVRDAEGAQASAQTTVQLGACS